MHGFRICFFFEALFRQPVSCSCWAALLWWNEKGMLCMCYQLDKQLDCFKAVFVCCFRKDIGLVIFRVGVERDFPFFVLSGSPAVEDFCPFPDETFQELSCGDGCGLSWEV